MTIPSSKPEVKCGNCGKPFERTGDHLSVVTQEYVCSPASTEVKCPKQGTLTPCSKDCPASPASPASTKVKCKNRYCASNTAFSQFGCTCPSPASTEVKCEHTKGFKCNLCRDTQIANNDFKSFPASTEEWEQEFKNKYDGYRNSGVGITKSDYLIEYTRSLLSSHDQQLRQRIVEEIEKKKKEHCGQKDCGQGQCVNRAARNKTLSDLLTFITNLK